MSTERRHLQMEAYRRWSHKPAAKATAALEVTLRFMAALFELQTQVVDAVEKGVRRIATFCTRRAGKTTLFATLLIFVAHTYPGVLCTYYAITRIRAKQLIWDELKRIDRDFALGMKFNETELEVRARTGSVIRLTGADKLSEAQKKLGDKNKLAIVDEAQLYAPEVLDILVNRVLRPTLLDLRGALVLGGTPGIVCDGLWYEITRNENADSEEKRAKGWTVYEWSLFQNPTLPHAREEVEKEISESGWSWTTPQVLREYGDKLGRPRWVNDANALFYKFDEAKNRYDGTLPKGHVWLFVQGVDLGHDDAYAREVWAFSETCRDIYEVESFKKSGLTPSDWRADIERGIQRWNPVVTVVDTGGLGKASVEEWKQRWGMNLRAAQKQNKADYVALYNDDLSSARAKFLPDSEVPGEMKRLPKDPRDPLAEHPGFPNHSCDASLYGWREAKHWLGEEKRPPPPPGSPEAAQAEADRLEREDADRMRTELAEARGDEEELWGRANEEDLWS